MTSYHLPTYLGQGEVREVLSGVQASVELQGNSISSVQPSRLSHAQMKLYSCDQHLLAYNLMLSNRIDCPGYTSVL